MGDFGGIPAAGLHFLDQLAEHNDRDWFEAHKQDYLDQVQAPALALVAALGERMKSISEAIVVDTRNNGSGSLLRIHRDTRFSPDKTPYKTDVTLIFWEGSGKKFECPAFGLHFGAHGGGLMAGIFQFAKPMLAAYREAVIDPIPGAELSAAINSVRKAGDYRVEGEHFKRVPSGFPADHERADLLRYNGLYALGPQISSAELMSADLVALCYDHFVEMAPLQRWLVKVQQGAEPDLAALGSGFGLVYDQIIKIDHYPQAVGRTGRQTHLARTVGIVGGVDGEFVIDVQRQIITGTDGAHFVLAWPLMNQIGRSSNRPADRYCAHASAR